MITDTLVIVGPGGIGKSPLDKILRNDLARIDPYRLRSSGPRDEEDVLYAHPKLRAELYVTYQRLGLSLTYLSEDVHWFPQAQTLFLRVRSEWQFLLLGSLPGGISKAEIFAPALLVILDNPQLRQYFGRLSMLILNPAASLRDLEAIKEKTRYNCEQRGDTRDSIEKRVRSLNDEVASWLKMSALGACECNDWQFPEFVYRKEGVIDTLIEARRSLTKRRGNLEIFFKTENEIRNSR